MWIYYETDGDAGWYAVRLFKYESKAQEYKDKMNDAYGRIEEISVDELPVKATNAAPENVKCPDCDGPMISRKSQYGTFWGCKAYPKCRGTRDSMGRSKAERDAEKSSSDHDNEVEPSAVDRIAENDKFRFRH